MKFLPAQLAYMMESGTSRRNLRLLSKFLVLLAIMIATYSVLFHVLMELEGQDHSWITGFYWTLTVMSTLGFGDITFTSDIGRIFSVVVLVSGVMFLLVVLPFTFIEFFYAPWLDAQRQRRAPRELPAGTKDHVILTNFDPVSLAIALNRQGALVYVEVATETPLDAWLELAERHAAGEDVEVFEGDAALREARKFRHAVPATMNERGAARRAHGGRKVSTDWAVPYRSLPGAIVGGLVARRRSG